MAFTRFLTVLLIALAAAGSGRAADTLYRNSGGGAPYAQDHHGGFLDLPVAEPFARPGVAAETQIHPSAVRVRIAGQTLLRLGRQREPRS